MSVIFFIICEPLQAWVRLDEVLSAILVGNEIHMLLRGACVPQVLRYEDAKQATEAFQQMLCEVGRLQSIQNPGSMEKSNAS